MDYHKEFMKWCTQFSQSRVCWTTRHLGLILVLANIGITAILLGITVMVFSQYGISMTDMSFWDLLDVWSAISSGQASWADSPFTGIICSAILWICIPITLSMNRRHTTFSSAVMQIVRGKLSVRPVYFMSAEIDSKSKVMLHMIGKDCGTYERVDAYISCAYLPKEFNPQNISQEAGYFFVYKGYPYGVPAGVFSQDFVRK